MGLVMKEEWWRAQYGSVDKFKMESGLAESVLQIVGEREANRRMKRTFEELAAQRWGGADLNTLLGTELMPGKPSKRFLGMMKTLAGVMPDVEEATKWLRVARNRWL